MKRLIQLSFLLAICLPSLMLSSCERDLGAEQEMRVQLSETDCPDLSPYDLDLSDGFRGTYSSSNDPEQPDFSFLGHDPNYVFPASAGETDCSGYCAFQVIFEPSNPQQVLDVSTLAVSQVTVSYMDGTSPVTVPVGSFAFSYPYLEVYETYSNTILDYHVEFAGNGGQELSIVETVVLGGLCVVENIDKTDPSINIVITHPRGNITN